MLKQILEEFLLIDGVTIAALVGSDGFVIEITQQHCKSDIAAIGALCSRSMRAFELGGPSIHMGSPRQMVLEYQNGVIIIIPVSPEEFLAIITDTTVGLGHLTYTIERTSSRVAAVI
jgi:predicted regulator of Ras-like GTPase activity (Roadblock/LC7/MglB family)